jgi:transposase
VLYDVSTLYYETDTGDGFRESGFSKERRLEPQITIGLLTDAAGFPLMVQAFEGNKAETLTMIPVIQAFMLAHGLNGVTVVADAGMVSQSNQEALEQAGLSFVIGGRILDVPPVVAQWRRDHPDESIPDGQIFTQPWPAGPASPQRDKIIYYQYRADRARRTEHGIDQQVKKAERAIQGLAPVKRNRFIQLTGGVRQINRPLETKARALAGLKSYITNLDATAEFVIDAYHQLWHVEKAFRMSKHDLKARPIYARKRESIEAHLTIVFAALAISHWIEEHTGWSIKKFVKTLRRYRTIEINTGHHTITAEDPLPDDLRTILNHIQPEHRH